MKRSPNRGLLLLPALATACAGEPSPNEETVSAGSALATSSFAAVADATVYEGSPDRNDGAAATLASDLTPNRWAYLRYSARNVVGTVTTAKLRIHVTEGTVDAPKIYATGTSWSETAITWRNKPAITGAVLDDRASVGPGWIEYDVTSRVAGDGDYSFALVPSSADGLYLGSRESAWKPELVVTTATGGTVAVPAGNATSNPSFEVNATGWTGWQAVVARVANAGAPNGSYVAKVSHASGTYYTIDDAPDAIAAATAGRSYEGCAHVAAATSSAVGKKARVVVRERSSAGLYKESSSAPLTLTTAFQRVCATATAQGSGDVIDVYVQQDGAASGDAFFADVISLVPAASTLPPPPPPPDATIGKGVAFHCMWSTYDDAKRIGVLDKLKAAGVTLVRIDMGWAGFQPNGPTEWNSWYGGRADACVNDAAARGMKVLIVDWLTPAWARSSASDQYTPPSNPQDYANFARTLAVRYGQKLAGIEVWNEPDPSQTFFKGTIEQYVGLLKATFPTVHAVSSVPIVLAGPAANDDVFIGKVYALGAGPSFDILSTHPYQGKADAPPEQPDDGNVWWFTHFPAVKAVMDRYGDAAKPVWFTEFGWSAHANTGGEAAWNLGVTEAQQADYLVRSYAYARRHYPNVRAMFWYNERNKQTGNVHQDNFGLLRADLSTKPVYHALAGITP